MPTSVAGRRPPPEIIDLLSSDDEVEIQPRQARTKRARRDHADHQAAAGADHDEVDDLELFMLARHPRDRDDEPFNEPLPPGQYVNVDGDQVFIPDEIIPPGSSQTPQPRGNMGRAPTPEMEARDFTLDFCLKAVLGIFPDVSRDHVTKLYEEANEVTAMNLSANLKLANVVENLISNGEYPKEEKQPARKKRRLEDEADDPFKIWESDKREVAPTQLKGTIAAMLKADFPEMPKQLIAQEVARHKHLYQTYVSLAKLKDEGTKKWLGRASLSELATADTIATNCGWAPMIEELKSARARVKEARRQRVIDEVKKNAELENLQRAIDNNETSECQVCFDDLPMNRQIHCDGQVAHFTCFSCAELYIKTEVGDARCRVECTAGCGAPFSRSQLYLLSDKPLLAKLEKLQQEKDVRDAGLEGLEECPMCIDFKIILGPVEEDSEFRCGNPECEQVSCRRCKAASHIPLSCEEHAKENKISTRHRIEERMTEALIRSCNKCKKKFIKDFGCNKMSCSSCGNLQCYCCSESIKDYRHFDHAPGATGQGNAKKCPLYDNSEARHEREVEEAEAAARKEVMEEDPDITEEDLAIKVSDAVKKSTEDRVRRAGPAGLGAAGPGPAYGGDIPGPFALRAFYQELRGERADLNEAGNNPDGEEHHYNPRRRIFRDADDPAGNRLRERLALAQRYLAGVRLRNVDERGHQDAIPNRDDPEARHAELLAGIEERRIRAMEEHNQRVAAMRNLFLRRRLEPERRAAAAGFGADVQQGQPIRQDGPEDRQLQPGVAAMQDEHDIPARHHRAWRLERDERDGILRQIPIPPVAQPQVLPGRPLRGLAGPFRGNVRRVHARNVPNRPPVAEDPQIFLPDAGRRDIAAPQIGPELPQVNPLDENALLHHRGFADDMAAHRAGRNAFVQPAAVPRRLANDNADHHAPQALAADAVLDAEQDPLQLIEPEAADNLYEGNPMDPWAFELVARHAAQLREEMEDLLGLPRRLR